VKIFKNLCYISTKEKTKFPTIGRNTPKLSSNKKLTDLDIYENERENKVEVMS